MEAYGGGAFARMTRVIRPSGGGWRQGRPPPGRPGRSTRGRPRAARAAGGFQAIVGQDLRRPDEDTPDEHPERHVAQLRPGDREPSMKTWKWAWSQTCSAAPARRPNGGARASSSPAVSPPGAWLPGQSARTVDRATPVSYAPALPAPWKGYIRGIASASPVAATIARIVPTRKSAQVFGRMAPRATMTKRIGRSRKWVRVGKCS